MRANADSSRLREDPTVFIVVRHYDRNRPRSIEAFDARSETPGERDAFGCLRFLILKRRRDVPALLIKQSRCQRASRPDLTVARARCIVDDNFTSSERHGHRPIEKSSVPVGSLRSNSNSKVSPAIDSQSRRRADIASSSGGIFGDGEARCDRDTFRRAEFFLEVEFFLGGELFRGVEFFKEGEPPCEPLSTD